MRLSGWREQAPHKDSLAPKVWAVLGSVLTTLGAEPDPEFWIVWGDDPASRYMVLVPTDPGLLVINVRVNVPQEGPRAGGKLVRWSRVQTGELAVEMAGGHRLLSFQVEGQVLRGADEEADAIAAFALDLFAAMDGRPRASTGAAAVTRGATARRSSRAKGSRPKSVRRTPADDGAPRLPAPQGTVG